MNVAVPRGVTGIVVRITAAFAATGRWPRIDVLARKAGTCRSTAGSDQQLPDAIARDQQGEV
ncbi:MAG: hypothetical protein ABI593_02630 [Betaproteobacteria bacterium]